MLEKVPVINKVAGEKPTAKVGVYRRRGDKYQFEIHEAARYRYDDKPNVHKLLETEEEIPAVGLENVYTMPSGMPYFEVVELDDDQFAPKKKALMSEDVDPNNLEVVWDEYEGNLVPAGVTMDKKNLEDKIVDNKDTILNFYLDHLEELQNKYDAKSFLKEHSNAVMFVITALAVGIIIHTSPIGNEEFMQILSDLLSQMETLNQNLKQNPVN